MKFFTRFDRPETDFAFSQEGEVSMTRQSEAESCDINKIMERFDRTGQFPISMKAPPLYGDARMVDFQTAKQIVIDAEAAFKELPAKTRQHFGHDPQNMLAALSDTSEANRNKLLELGMLVEREESPELTLQRIAKNTEPKKEEIAPK